MQSSSSRLTKKFQTTIPRLIRQELGLHEGDIVRFELRKGEAVLKKETPLDLAFLQAVESQFTEWQSKSDEQAYGGL